MGLADTVPLIFAAGEAMFYAFHVLVITQRTRIAAALTHQHCDVGSDVS